MKKALFAVLMLTAINAKAIETNYTIGDVTLKLPLAKVSAVYLYDLFNRETLVGGETPVATYKNITAVVGAVTDLDGLESRAGVPFMGIHVDAPQGVFTESFAIGMFYGRDFKRGDNIGGLKASLKIW